MHDRGADARDEGDRPKIADRLVRDVREREVLETAQRLGVSRKRLLGWEPTVTHEHFDADGNLTGYTIVRTDVEFDDFERDRHLALAEFQRGVGPCGFHHSLTTDPDNGFTFDVKHCPVCAGSDRFDRVQKANDEFELAELKSRHGGKIPPEVPQPGDGRRTYVRPMSESEVDARKVQAPTRA